MLEKYQYYANIVSSVDETIQKIAELPISKCHDTQFLEQSFIPSLGLNNEYLSSSRLSLRPISARAFTSGNIRRSWPVIWSGWLSMPRRYAITRKLVAVGRYLHSGQ